MGREVSIEEVIEIDSIEEVPYDGYVYGIRVKNDKSFCLSGRILSKNSDLPDIDMDFEDRKRPLIIEHLRDKYGEWNVAEVSNFMRMKGRGAVTNVSRVFDLPLVEVKKATKSIVTRSSGDFRENFSIEDAFKTFEDGIRFKEKYPDIVDLSIAFEDSLSAYGRHAAGVVVSDADLRSGKNCNLALRKDHIVCNWDKETAEYNGLMKLDVLGLNNLTILSEAKRLVKERKGIDVDFNQIDLEDKLLLEQFTEGNTIGVFQFNSPSMIKLCRDIKAEEFSHVVALNALHRPGALRCVSGDTIVKTSSGYKRIDELKNMQPIMSSARPDFYKGKYVKNYINCVSCTGKKKVFLLKDSIGNKIKCTENHKFWTKDRGWTELQNLSKGDNVLTIRRQSEEWKNKISKIIKENENCISTRFKKNSEPWNKGIPQSEFNPYINKVVNSAESPWHSKKARAKWHHNMFVKDGGEKWRKAVEKMTGTQNKFWKSRNNRIRHSLIMKGYYKNNPHPNESMSSISRPQIELFDAISEYYDDCRLNFKIVTGSSAYYADVALLSEKIDIEFDGDYWHENPGEREEPRDSEIEKAGWSVVRLTYSTYKGFINDICTRPIKNSTKWGEVKSIEYVGVQKTYDISCMNEDFPNYIANNFIVHNSGFTQIYRDRKHGLFKTEYKHPIMEEITKSTQGLIIYQEQVMRLMYDMAGLPWRTADTIRKTISKSKGVDEFLKFKEGFVAGCKRLGTLSEEDADKIFDDLKNMGSYSFNLSHATTYSLIAMWDMYMKMYHPVEYMCSSLSYGPDTKKLELINETKRLGIKIVLPDINKSDSHLWIIDGDDSLISPFSEIKGVGEKAAEVIVEERNKNGPYLSPENLESRVPKRQCNSRVRDRLIRSYSYLTPEEKALLTDDKLEELNDLFEFELSNDPLYKYRNVIKKIGEHIEIIPINESGNKSARREDARFYFGRIMELRAGYIQAVSEEKDSLGGIYCNFRDDTDFKQVKFTTELYRRRKYRMEHCSGEAMLTKAYNTYDRAAFFTNDVWFGDDLLSGNLGGLDLNMAEFGEDSGKFDYRRLNLSACEACELRNECKSPVYPTAGRMNAMIIGEAPGRQENDQEKGFVGESGQLLFNGESRRIKNVKGLNHYGLERDMFYVSNVIKCWPSRTKTPKKKHIEECSFWIKEEIKMVKPFLILAFGNTCNSFFRGKDSGIMEINGQTFWNDEYNCWITFSVHPAMVTYDVANKELFEAGIKEFADRMLDIGFEGEQIVEQST